MLHDYQEKNDIICIQFKKDDEEFHIIETAGGYVSFKNYKHKN